MHKIHIFTISQNMCHIALINFLLTICLQWLVYMPTTMAMALGSQTDKEALLALKDKLTNGLPNYALLSWNDSLHFCDWEGVQCNRHHIRVSTLNLTEPIMGGTLAPAIGNLTFLTMLNLSHLGLHGEIPKEIGRLKRLQSLNLSWNNLEGEIPNELTNCTKLQVISLSYNNLTGEVPFWFGSMLKLHVLFLGANSLTGTIPPSLGNLSSLERLTIAANHLEGSIPVDLGGLPNLKVLYLGGNNLSGAIPHSLYNLSTIQMFDLASNQLSGTLPSNLGHAFPNLRGLFIGANQLTGIIPHSISYISGLQDIDVAVNIFYGSIPLTLGRLKNLQMLYLNNNNFGSGGAHDLDFISSLTNCSLLDQLDIHDNNFGGRLPNSIVNLSTNLTFLDVSYNSIYGNIPEEIGQLVSLIDLGMRTNNFTGRLPFSIGKLENLQRLRLQENKLSGNISSVIGNLTMVFTLTLDSNNFEGHIPFEIRHCTSLQYLNLSRNNLHGNLPNHIFGDQTGLISLDISHNILGGPLPSDLGNLKQLVQLSLSGNKLSSNIPFELGDCKTLEVLEMDGNFFQGSIPSSLSSLKSLQILDLSKNYLSGTIPHTLANLTLLQNLNLSFNHLHGEVPLGGVFNNISAISLTGNDDLCGGIPQLKLPSCYISPSKKPKKSLEKKFILIPVFSGIFIVFVIIICVYVRKPKKLSSSSQPLQDTFLRISYGELHEATNGFSSSNLVGIGSFGSVYRGISHHYEIPIAVKVLNLQSCGASKSFTSECKTLSKVRHRNVVKILTCCSSVDYKGADFKALVFEFMPNGSLENWLHIDEQHERGNLILNLTQRLDIAIDVAEALNYLHHDLEEAIVHCDIKPSNILLDDDVIAHLGDFGLARLLHGATGFSNRDQTTSSAIKGTIGYVAPEYGAGGRVFPEGDIYSYGILILEMLTGRKPTDSMFVEDLSLHKLCNMALPDRVIEIVDPNLLVPYAEDQDHVTRHNDVVHKSLVSFVGIGVACSVEVPSERMGIKEVIVELRAIKKKLSKLRINVVARN